MLQFVLLTLSEINWSNKTDAKLLTSELTFLQSDFGLIAAALSALLQYFNFCSFFWKVLGWGGGHCSPGPRWLRPYGWLIWVGSKKWTMRGVLNLMALVKAANCNQQLKGLFLFWQKKSIKSSNVYIQLFLLWWWILLLKYDLKKFPIADGNFFVISTFARIEVSALIWQFVLYVCS